MAPGVVLPVPPPGVLWQPSVGEEIGPAAAPWAPRGEPGDSENRQCGFCADTRPRTQRTGNGHHHGLCQSGKTLSFTAVTAGA